MAAEEDKQSEELPEQLIRAAVKKYPLGSKVKFRDWTATVFPRREPDDPVVAAGIVSGPPIVRKGEVLLLVTAKRALGDRISTRVREGNLLDVTVPKKRRK